MKNLKENIFHSNGTAGQEKLQTKLITENKSNLAIRWNRICYVTMWYAYFARKKLT
jgi:hypothetical protein